MPGLELLIYGFSVALRPENLMASFTGVLLGTMVGVLPGLGPTATLSLLFPIVVRLGPVTGLIMMAGVWYGAQYGGSTTSILVNIPGEASSVITCLDGYQMAKKGRAGAALALVAIGSFVAGTVGIIGLQLFAPLLAQAALKFGPPEYLALMILSFVILSSLTSASIARGFLMLVMGLWLATIGIDPLDAVQRFTFGVHDLKMGIDLLPVAMGLFGIGEILFISLGDGQRQPPRKVRFRELYPSREEARRAIGPMARGSVLGFFIGLLPGPAPTISTFVAYSVEKRISRKPEEFGTGAVEGVVGPESANNSAVVGSMIPLLALGIPFAPSAAVLLAGLRMHNINPGPLLFQTAPELVWGFIASLYLGNFMLLVLNLPLVGLFARLAVVRPQVLMPVVAIICLVGVYSVRNSLFDIWVMVIAGVFGLALRRLSLPIAPLVIGLVLGPMTENSFRQSSMMLNGNLLMILERPMALFLLVTTVVFLLFNNYRTRKAAVAFGDQD